MQSNQDVITFRQLTAEECKWRHSHSTSRHRCGFTRHSLVIDWVSVRWICGYDSYESPPKRKSQDELIFVSVQAAISPICRVLFLTLQWLMAWLTAMRFHFISTQKLCTRIKSEVAAKDASKREPQWARTSPLTPPHILLVNKFSFEQPSPPMMCHGPA